MRTTSSWWLLSMAEEFRAQGLPVRDLFEQSGLSTLSLMQSHVRYPQDAVTRLWELAEEASGNDHLGFDVGSRISVSGFPVLAYSLITSSNLLEGFQRFHRLQSMIGESADVSLELEGSRVAVHFVLTGDQVPVSYHAIDAAIAGLVKMGRMLAGTRIEPERVTVRRKPSRAVDLFTEFYGCPVEFKAERDSIYLPADVWDETNFIGSVSNNSNKEPGDYIEKYLANNTDEKPTTELAETLIRQKLQDGVVSKEWLAALLSITPRTLQRRLDKEGESYQGILDRVREELALYYLSSPGISQIEVAFLCGFSDLAAFHHAFKRWRKQTPGEYKKSLSLDADD